MDDHKQLKRQVGFGGAVLLGLGAMLGAGVFVSLGLAAGLCGPAVVLAIPLAGLLAMCNGLSSAQLAAAHPVSGGTYAYGYRFLHPRAGFLAGWLFLLAKSASAATAALGLSGYLLYALDLRLDQSTLNVWHIILSLIAVAFVTVPAYAGIRQSNRVNAVIVTLTLLSLLWFMLVSIPTATTNAPMHFEKFFTAAASDKPYLLEFLQGCALVFVAYTGYARVATLGEEITRPERTIPRAIIATIMISILIYVLVGLMAVAAVSAPEFADMVDEQAAVLEAVAAQYSLPWIVKLISVGAITAMLGVLLNLVLGLSRVILALARQGDLPLPLAEIRPKSGSPNRAVVLAALIIAGLVLIGSVKIAWTFSAFCVLLYYGLTNICALRLPKESRRYPRWIAGAGLVGCLLLAFMVPMPVWLTGLGLCGVGLILQNVMNRMYRKSTDMS